MTIMIRFAVGGKAFLCAGWTHRNIVPGLGAYGSATMLAQHVMALQTVLQRPKPL